MKKLINRIITAGAVGVAITAVVLISIGKAPFDRLAEQQIISIAQSQGVRLSLRNTTLHRSGINAEGGEAFFTNALILLPFSNLRFRPHFGRLLTGTFGATVEAEIAQAATALTVGQENDDRVTLDLNMTGAHIAELPVFSFFGITDGMATISIDHADISPKMIRSGNFSLSASEVTRPNRAPLQLTVSGFPFNLELPEIRDGSLTFNASADTNTISISRIESLSSIGTFSLKGDIKLDEQLRVSSLTIKGEVHLSSDGHRAFRSFLPLLSQGALKLDSKSFAFEVSGTPPALRNRFTVID